MPPQMRFILTTPSPRCDVAESFASATARPSRGQYDFVDIVEAGQGLIRSPVIMPRLLLELLTEQRMLVMRESEEFYTQLHDA
uniref:Uncharacterized protein n=1 Tax=Tanacetum cinerariifolium TaxID=118510 RepID=A0A699VZB0_TANCI|nr:hypothetical protein [Tanacetum cinerariifolium]